jgi:hypothetical protein
MTTLSPPSNHAPPGLAAEWAVIFRSAGSPPPGGWDQLEPWGGRPLHWLALLESAHGEGALPRLARLATEGAFPGMPREIRDQLRMVEQFHAIRAGMLEDRLVKLAAAFDGGGVPFLALKGAALASTVYRGFQDRPMGDLDLLVAPGHARAAVELALASGWKTVDGIPGEVFYGGHQHLPPLKDARDVGIGLDLHLHILPAHAPFRLPVEEIWASAEPASALAVAVKNGNAASPPVRVPSVSVLLLHACIHFAWSHTLSAGGWKVIRDVTLLLRSPLLDRDHFLALARSARAVGSADWTLHLVQELGGVEAAGELREGLGVTGSTLRRKALTRHFSTLMSRGVPPELPVRLPRLLWELALLPDREGHGRARPWDQDELFHQESGSGERPEGPQAGPLVRLREALEYLAHLGSPRPGGPPRPRGS